MTPEDPQALSITYDHLSELIGLQARRLEQKIDGQYLDLRQRIEQPSTFQQARDGLIELQQQYARRLHAEPADTNPKPSKP